MFRTDDPLHRGSEVIEIEIDGCLRYHIAPLALIGSSHQPHEFLDGHPRLSNDRPERPAIQFLMVRYDELRERIIAPHNDVASLLSDDNEPGPSKRFDAFLTGDARQHD